MVKTELIKRSPLRILEKSIRGGLDKGNIGIVASRKGIGKTACLVHIATDRLFQGQHVIHVSFSGRTDHIINWYEDIFKEIAKKRELEYALDVHDEIIKNRVIMNFSQDGVTTEQIMNGLEAMIRSGNFAADVIVVDGFDFEKGSSEGFLKLKEFAKDLGVVLWFSASLKGAEPVFNDRGIPRELEYILDQADVMITLHYEKDHVRLRLVKDHGLESIEDLHLQLDPKTLLIAEEK